MRRTLAITLLICLRAYCQSAGDLQVTSGLPRMVETYLTGIAERQWNERAHAIAEIRTAQQVAARQNAIRGKFTELLGGWPERTALNARVTGTLDRGDYRVEKLVYESLPALYVTANVFIPKNANAPYPAVLGVAGHSNAGKAEEKYQRAWIELARRGFLVLAIDPPGQGERIQYFDPKTGGSSVGIGTPEHSLMGLKTLLTGVNLARYFLWDDIRGVDYLLTRGDVDEKRIAVAGNSGGGMQAAYMAAVEPRLAAAAPSCFMTSEKRAWSDLGPQDAEQDIVNFLSSGLDRADFAFAFAPKPMLINTATRDFFPIAGAHDILAEERRIFGIVGDPARLGFFEFDDTHGWSKPRRESTYRWFEKWLHGREDEGVEREAKIDAEADLRSTPTGQLANSLGGETIESINAKVARQLRASRTALKLISAGELRALIAGRIAFQTTARSVPRVRLAGTIAREGYSIEKIGIASEPGITVPALLFASHGARRPAVIYLNPAGKSADAAPGGAIEKLMQSGASVIAIDPRGWGESANAAGKPPHNERYRNAQRAFLVGRTMAGMQVTDTLAAFDYLLSRGDIDPARISIAGKGNGSVLALYAAALEPRILEVSLEGGVRSYLDLLDSRDHGLLADLVIPGVFKSFDLEDVVRAIAPRKVRRS